MLLRRVDLPQQVSGTVVIPFGSIRWLQVVAANLCVPLTKRAFYFHKVRKGIRIQSRYDMIKQ